MSDDHAVELFRDRLYLSAVEAFPEATVLVDDERGGWLTLRVRDGEGWVGWQFSHQVVERSYRETWPAMIAEGLDGIRKALD